MKCERCENGAERHSRGCRTYKEFRPPWLDEPRKTKRAARTIPNKPLETSCVSVDLCHKNGGHTKKCNRARKLQQRQNGNSALDIGCRMPRNKDGLCPRCLRSECKHEVSA